MISTIAQFSQIDADPRKWIDLTAAKQPNNVAIKRYLKEVETVKTVDDFLKNDTVFRFALKAYGLQDMIYAKALIRKVLTEGIDSPSAFANKFSDRRFSELASTFNFARYGEATTVFDKTRQGTVDKFLEVSLEEDAGNQSENLRLALYFKRKALGITSPYQILADKALTRVTYAALNLPSTTSLASIDKQAELLKSRIDFSLFSDRSRISAFIQRFAALADTATAGSSSPSAASLISASPSAILNPDILLSLQSMRNRSR